MRIRAVVIFLVLSTGVFAQELSGGLAVSGGWFLQGFRVSNSSLSVSTDLAETFLPTRIEVFLDGRYFSAAVGFKVAFAGHEKQTQTISGTTSTVADMDLGTKGYVSLAFYAKYPFTVGPILLFPILGMEIDTNVLYLDAGGNDVRATLTTEQLSSENQAWVKAASGRTGHSLGAATCAQCFSWDTSFPTPRRAPPWMVPRRRVSTQRCLRLNPSSPLPSVSVCKPRVPEICD